jgi:hypothetical protein
MKIRELLEGRDYSDPVRDSGMSDWDYADQQMPRRRGRSEPDDDFSYHSTSKVKWKNEPGEIYGKSYNTVAIVDELDLENRAWLQSLKSMPIVDVANRDGKTYVYYMDSKR